MNNSQTTIKTDGAAFKVRSAEGQQTGAQIKGASDSVTQLAKTVKQLSSQNLIAPPLNPVVAARIAANPPTRKFTKQLTLQDLLTNDDHISLYRDLAYMTHQRAISAAKASTIRI